MSTPTKDLKVGDEVELTGKSWSSDHPLANPDDPVPGQIVTVSRVYSNWGIAQAEFYNPRDSDLWYISDERPGGHFEDDYSGTRVGE